MHPRITPSEQKWLTAFHTCIEEQLHRVDLTAEELASLMNCSERQFYRRVKKLTEQSPNAILKEARLQRAFQYLKKGQFSTIGETAKAVGFKDPFYFSKQFYARFGVHPSKFE